jgi:hypothetical protein
VARGFGEGRGGGTWPDLAVALPGDEVVVVGVAHDVVRRAEGGPPPQLRHGLPFTSSIVCDWVQASSIKVQALFIGRGAVMIQTVKL